MTIRYEELRRLTEYSFKLAYGRLPDHVQRTAELGMQTICVTDVATLRYAYALQESAREDAPEGATIRPIYGCILNLVADHKTKGLPADVIESIDLTAETKRERQSLIRDEEKRRDTNKTWDICVRAMTADGFRNLSRITSISWDNEGGCHRGVPRADLDLLERYNDGLSISFGGPDSLLGDMIINGRLRDAIQLCQRLLATFAGRFWLEITPHAGVFNKKLNGAFALLSKKLGIPLIAVNNVHYVRETDTDAHTVLLCMSSETTLLNPDHPTSPIGYHLRNGDEMAAAFADGHPEMDTTLVLEAIERTVDVAALHTYKMEIDRFKALVPHVEHSSASDLDEVRRLCVAGWKWRDIPALAKNAGIPLDVYVKRLKHELGPEGVGKFPTYFLIVRDLIQWCRGQGIMTGPGRGSAAGSLVCFLLGITSLDPIEHGLLFERFISPSRIDMPDIDMDFEDHRREEVITYLHDKYGHDKVSLIATVGKMRGKSALRDVARVLGIDQLEVSKVTSAIVERSSGDERASQTVEDSFKEFQVCKDFDAKYPHVLPLVKKLEGHSKQTGVHAAGVITSPVQLPDVAPVETHVRNGSVVKLAAWDMYGVAAAGLLKLDILGLRTLSVLADAVRKVKERRGIVVDLETVNLNDPDVLKKFTDHEYVGIFQYDSTGAHAACEGIVFDSFQDVSALVALNRPGTMRSGLATEYKKRKTDPAKIRSVHPLYDAICSDTLGVMVYQEHVMRIFVEMAGYTPGTADSLRKKIAKKWGDEAIGKEREQFIKGCEANGVDKDLAGRIMSDITFFGSYGFNKSHSAAYGLISYWGMWLKTHYPLEFMWSLMKHEPQREEIARFATEARRLGIEVMPPDVNSSGVGFTIDSDGNIRSSLADIKNVGETAIVTLVDAQPFKDAADFFDRVAGRSVNSRVIESLIKAGAMRSMFPNTKWALETIKDKNGWLDVARKKRDGWEDALREMVAASKSVDDYDHEDLLHLAGEVSPLGGGKHPMEVYKAMLETELAGVHFTPLNDPMLWESGTPLIRGVIIEIKYNQVGDFETVEPDEATKKRMSWGARYANINIEDESGTQIRVKVDINIFDDFREIIDQGLGTCVAARVSVNKGFKSARCVWMADLEMIRQKLKLGIGVNGWERLLHGAHPASEVKAGAGVVTRSKALRRASSVRVKGIIAGMKHSFTRKDNRRMGFFQLELEDRSCVDVVVFPDIYVDWRKKLVNGAIVTAHLKMTGKSAQLTEDGIVVHTSPI